MTLIIRAVSSVIYPLLNETNKTLKTLTLIIAIVIYVK